MSRQQECKKVRESPAPFRKKEKEANKRGTKWRLTKNFWLCLAKDAFEQTMGGTFCRNRRRGNLEKRMSGHWSQTCNDVRGKLGEGGGSGRKRFSKKKQRVVNKKGCLKFAPENQTDQRKWGWTKEGANLGTPEIFRQKFPRGGKSKTIPHQKKKKKKPNTRWGFYSGVPFRSRS